MDSNLAFLRKQINNYEIDKDHIIRHMKETADREEKQRLGDILDQVCVNLDNYHAIYNMYFKREDIKQAS